DVQRVRDPLRRRNSPPRSFRSTLSPKCSCQLLLCPQLMEREARRGLTRGSQPDRVAVEKGDPAGSRNGRGALPAWGFLFQSAKDRGSHSAIRDGHQAPTRFCQRALSPWTGLSAHRAESSGAETSPDLPAITFCRPPRRQSGHLHSERDSPLIFPGSEFSLQAALSPSRLQPELQTGRPQQMTARNKAPSRYLWAAWLSALVHRYGNEFRP